MKSTTGKMILNNQSFQSALFVKGHELSFVTWETHSEIGGDYAKFKYSFKNYHD